MKKGFTLAEVLITLGIIGVVAAITMPTLIQNYQKQVYVNQLKKTYSTLEQGFQKMLADEEVEKLSDLPYWGQYYEEMFSGDATVVKQINNILSNGFKTSYGYQSDYKLLGLYPEDGYVNHIQLADGSAIVYAATFNWSEDGGGSNILIDVNGTKSPNKLGKDIFCFDVSNRGKLTSCNGSCGGTGGYDDLGCAGRIIKNGWKMDY